MGLRRAVKRQQAEINTLRERVGQLTAQLSSRNERLTQLQSALSERKAAVIELRRKLDQATRQTQHGNAADMLAQLETASQDEETPFVHDDEKPESVGES